MKPLKNGIFSKSIAFITGILISLIIYFLFTPIKVMADTPYKTFTLDGYGRIVETQTAYIPVTSITKVGELSFKNASDMKITDDEEIYIADTGGKRFCSQIPEFP